MAKSSCLPSFVRPLMQATPTPCRIISAETFVPRILDTLKEERALHGHGTTLDLDHLVGRSRGYMGRVLRGEIGLQVDMLFHILDALEVDPSNFFATVVGMRLEPKTQLGRILRRLRAVDELPALDLGEDAEARLRRLSQRPPLSQGMPPGTHSTPREGVAGTPEWAETLADLDAQSFWHPAAACEAMSEMLRQALAQAEDRPQDIEARCTLARCLGVAASVEHSLYAPKRAVRCLRAAFDLCDDPTSLLYGDLLERASYQLRNHRPEGAAGLARQAVELYLHAGCLPGVGRALVAQACMTLRSGQPRAALHLCGAAETYLPTRTRRAHYSACRVKARSHLQLQQFEAADAAVQQALALHATRRGHLWWRLRWLQAEVAYRLGRLEVAEDLFRQCKDRFDETSYPLETAKLTLQLSKVMLALGRLDELHRMAAHSIILLRPLKQHRRVCEVLQDLPRRTLTSKLSLPWLEKAERCLDRELQRVAR